MGPRIDPCGTPLIMGNLSEMWWPNFTFFVTYFATSFPPFCIYY